MTLLEAEIAHVANRTTTLVGGDWNAKPGNDHENNHCLGHHAKYRSISSMAPTCWISVTGWDYF